MSRIANYKPIDRAANVAERLSMEQGTRAAHVPETLSYHRAIADGHHRQGSAPSAAFNGGRNQMDFAAIASSCLGEKAHIAPTCPPGFVEH